MTRRSCTIVLDKDTGGVKAIVNTRTLTALRLGNAGEQCLDLETCFESVAVHSLPFLRMRQSIPHKAWQLRAWAHQLWPNREGQKLSVQIEPHFSTRFKT